MKSNKTTPRKKRVIRVGNDGYGTKNVKITKYKYGVEISVADPHDWGRERSLFLKHDVIEALIEFVNQ